MGSFLQFGLDDKNGSAVTPDTTPFASMEHLLKSGTSDKAKLQVSSTSSLVHFVDSESFGQSAP
jgi:hypothetical protein